MCGESGGPRGGLGGRSGQVGGIGAGLGGPGSGYEGLRPEGGNDVTLEGDEDGKGVNAHTFRRKQTSPSVTSVQTSKRGSRATKDSNSCASCTCWKGGACLSVWALGPEPGPQSGTARVCDSVLSPRQRVVS